MAHWAALVLLALAVAAVAVTAAGIVAARTVFDRLHYLGPAASVGPACVAAAVVLREGLSQAGIKAILVALVILVMNPVLTHATARAARVRRSGALLPAAHPPAKPGDDA